MTTTQTIHDTTELAIVIVVQIPNVPGRDVAAYADTIARMATASHDATILGYAVHGDPDVGWAAITANGERLVQFRIPDDDVEYVCPSCGGDRVATEDDGTASCDDCGAQGVCADEPRESSDARCPSCNESYKDAHADDCALAPSSDDPCDCGCSV